MGQEPFFFSPTLLEPKDPILKLRATCCSAKSKDRDARVGELVLLASCVFSAVT